MELAQLSLPHLPANPIVARDINNQDTEDGFASDAEVAMINESARGFTLYVNCAPFCCATEDDKQTSIPLTHVVSDANRSLFETDGKADYRLYDFGRGPAALCLAVKGMHEDGYFADVDGVVLDVRTPEGSVLLETLSALAYRVVRGF